MREAETCSVIMVLRCLEDLNPREIEKYFKDNHLRLLTENKLWENAFNLISWNCSKQKFVHKFTKDQIISTIKNSISRIWSNNLTKNQESSPIYQSPRRKSSSIKNSVSKCLDAREIPDSLYHNSIFGGCLKRESPLNDCSTKSNSLLTIRDSNLANPKISEFNELGSFDGANPKLTTSLDRLNYSYLTKKRAKDSYANRSEIIELNGTEKQDSSSIGLKDITRKVIELLKICQNTTYKVLSKQIVDQLPVDSENESKNIRRRIYDAINVLKAINCLKQDNSKQISLNHHEFDEKFEIQDEAVSTMISRQQILNRKKEDLRDKQFTSNSHIKKMVDSNRSNSINENIDKRISFPFLAACSKSQDRSSISIFSSEKRKKLVVSSDKPLLMKGELDLLWMLNKISD